ncbi:PqqD family peptide modification chaperone [Arsenicitalea aurantiaca]|uniref:PqqD family peptide modification chaperone n=1 Tax=Arsenicitalea aurantiaca TaxID=1783274 RepID=A0A433X443_9HYPH|nr:PqqD family protein [Arsenicitalea aurantiaca]RUT28836.1 PqqD family peptide modification chaperone [Arsenicitalea aurantiaca]
MSVMRAGQIMDASRSGARGEVSALRFAGTDRTVVFENAEPVAGALSRVLKLWPAAPAAPRGGGDDIAITGTGRAFSCTAPTLDTPYDGLTSVSAACCAIVDIARAFLEKHTDMLCLHCAAFEIGGRLVVIAGHARAGKSTLAARLAAEPVALYCDDMLPIHPASGQGMALGVPPRLRLPLPASASRPFRDFLAHHAGPADTRYAYLDAPRLVPHGRTAPIGAIILLDRRVDGPAGFAAASRSETLQHLLLRNLSHERPAAELAAAMETLMTRTLNLRLFYSDLDEVAALLCDAFRVWPRDAESLVSGAIPGSPLPLEENDLVERIRPGLDAQRAYRRALGIGVRAIDGELFLIDDTQQAVLHLNQLATGVWNLLEDPVSIAEATDILACAFPAMPRQIIGGDVEALFADLCAHRLIAPV